MQEFINSVGGPVPAALLLMVAFNAFMTGLKSALEHVMDKTANTVDNKVHAVVAKVCGLLTAAIDLLTANKPH